MSFAACSGAPDDRAAGRARASWEDGALGGSFALQAAVTFAWTNATAGAASGTAVQPPTLSIPIGLPIFFAALVVSGQPGLVAGLPPRSHAGFCLCCFQPFHHRPLLQLSLLAAIGTNLAGPVMQFSLAVLLWCFYRVFGRNADPVADPWDRAVPRRPDDRVARIHARAPPPPRAPRTSRPRLAEGYAFALLGSICYGASPVLVRYALAVRGSGRQPRRRRDRLGRAATAATLIPIAAARPLVGGARRAPARGQTVRYVWGILVYLSQIFAYMAVAVAPVTRTAPIIALANVFRIYLSRFRPPPPQVFGPDAQSGRQPRLSSA